MRYQDKIYIQNENSAVKNKDIFNVGMSSDICIFYSPTYYINGASKINCTGSTSVHIVEKIDTNIQLSFIFTGNNESFVTTDAKFNYEIYKYNNGVFQTSPIYQSELIPFSALTPIFAFAMAGAYYINQNIPIKNITLDGEYIIKGYYQLTNCTDYLGKLNKIVNTLNYKSGKEYNIYDSELDYYFVAFTKADVPQFNNKFDPTPPNASLNQQIIVSETTTNIIPITNDFAGDVILTFNGIVLAKDLDYTLDTSASVITLSAYTEPNDIISLIYTKIGINNISVDTIEITTPITSGATNLQGSDNIYYNTGTSKYEIYTTNIPTDNSGIIIMLNGVTLANGIDYYQSISNKSRIILEGILLLGDIITIVYYPMASVINGLDTSTPIISWMIDAPQTNNGVFTLEVSTASTFNNFFYTGNTNYVANQSSYVTSFVASGDIGTKLYYRVKNNKKYTSLCNNVYSSVVYSETVPIIIQSNSINSY